MSFNLKVSNYKVGRTLGQGAYGKVKLAENETIGEPVAFKVLNKHKIRKLGMQEKVKREVKAMKKLQHPHIVCLYQVIDTQSDIFLALELATGGDMYDRICSHGKLGELESKRLFRQLTAALVFSHSKGVAHRDLKLENLLFDANQNLKICDFGLCNMMQDGASLTTACGSPDYAAPEILEHKAYDGTKIDAWSSGVILYTMLYGQLPFDGANQSQMFQKVLAGDFSFKDDVASVSNEAKDLIKMLLNPDPCNRYSMRDALAHPWLSEGLDQSSYLVSYSKFLSANKINLKPKSTKDLDPELVQQLQAINEQFRFEDQNHGLSYGQIIAKFFKSCHRKSSSLNKKVGRDAFAVQNLCVAYKFLQFRKLNDAACQNESTRLQSLQNATHVEAQTFQTETTALVTQKQQDRLAKLRIRLTRKATQSQPSVTAQNAQNDASGKFKLLFSVDAPSAGIEQVGISAVIDLVCKALLQLGCTWQFSQCPTNEKVIDGSVVAVQGPKGDTFLIFFHAALEMPTVRNLKYYAVDFGVKKHEGVCHISRFDAISEAYQAILGVLKAAHTEKSGAINAPQPASLVQLIDPLTMHSELSSQIKASVTPEETKDNDIKQETATPTGEQINEKDGGKSSHRRLMTSLETIETRDTLTDQPESCETIMQIQ